MSQKVKAKKTLGQNFLKDNKIASLMVNSLELNPSDNIVEIGGGTGILTRLIVDKSSKYNKFYVYEIDSDLKPGLEKILNELDKNKLVFENFLDANFDDLNRYKIIGSLPYYITSPIIHKILKQKNRPELCVFLVQKEVGEKLISKTPKASYWSYITLGYEVEKIAIVKAESFNPAPKVDSMIIKFTKNKDIEDFWTQNNLSFLKWEKFLHHVYKNPRKMINKTFKKEFLEELKIDPSLRPQNLNLTDLLKLYKK